MADWHHGAALQSWQLGLGHRYPQQRGSQHGQLAAEKPDSPIDPFRPALIQVSEGRLADSRLKWRAGLGL